MPAMMLASSSSLLLIAVVFLGLFVAAGYAGGRQAAQNLQPQPADGAPGRGPGFGSRPSGSSGFGGAPAAPAVSTHNPQVDYNMGVQAALGGRREEARQHFTRVLQTQPRNVAAWLQLANLADAPDQAWNYVQQARSISPNDPAVLEAVDIIWPQVAASAEKQDVPRNKPPYTGGQLDDNAIPRSRLPGTVLDAAEDSTPTVGDSAPPPPDASAPTPDLPSPGLPSPDMTPPSLDVPAASEAGDDATADAPDDTTDDLTGDSTDD